MSIVLLTPSNGSVTLAEQNTASNVTVTVPARTANVMLDGPTFVAFASAAQNISSSTLTKVAFNSITFDTNSNYSIVNNRFTPTVAGYYQTNAMVSTNNGTNYPSSFFFVYINKNNAGTAVASGAAVTPFSVFGVSGIIYMNGSTDYIECFVQQSAANPLPCTGQHFSAALVRGA